MRISLGRSRESNLHTLLMSAVAAIAMTIPVPVWAQTPGTFALTDGMSVARRYHTATLLLDGSVLITGGLVSGGEVTATAEIYYPTIGAFALTGSMNFARYLHTATLLPDGKVFIQGDATEGNGSYNPAAAEIYDPVSGSFTETSPPPAAMLVYQSVATLLTNGQVLIVGGYTVMNFQPIDDMDLYDPLFQTFGLAAYMSGVRADHTATLLTNGKVLIAGGTNFCDGTGGTLSTAEIYDPSANQDAAPIEMNFPREGHTATLLRNGRVLIAGGYSDLQAEIFEPRGKFVKSGKLHQARAHHTATLLPNGEVLLAGDVNPSELYRIDGYFGVTGPLLTSRTAHTATMLNNGQVLIVGGMTTDSSHSILASAELYTPPSMPEVRIMSPAPHSILQNTAIISVAVASDVQSATLYIDRQSLTSSPPYNFTWIRPAFLMACIKFR